MRIHFATYIIIFVSIFQVSCSENDANSNLYASKTTELNSKKNNQELQNLKVTSSSKGKDFDYRINQASALHCRDSYCEMLKVDITAVNNTDIPLCMPNDYFTDQLDMFLFRTNHSLKDTASLRNSGTPVEGFYSRDDKVRERLFRSWPQARIEPGGQKSANITFDNLDGFDRYYPLLSAQIQYYPCDERHGELRIQQPLAIINF